jgi:hypothetical protein
MKSYLAILLAISFLTAGCGMHLNKKVVAVSALAIGSAIVSAKADQDCRRNVGVGPCYGGYGPAKAEEGINIGLAAFSAAMGAWWHRDFGKGWWVFPVGISAWNFQEAARAWNKHCPPGKHLDMHDPFGGRYCE